MRITTKLLLSILGVFALSMCGNMWVLHATIVPTFERIDEQNSIANHQRVKEAVGAVQDKLKSASKDWGFWDDMKNYTLGIDAERFVETNLSAFVEALEGLQINALMVRDSANKVLWSKSFDHAAQTEMPDLSSELARLEFVHPYLKKAGQIEPVAGLIKTSRGLMVVSVAPVVASDRTGDPTGSVLMATFLDKQKLREMTSVAFELLPPAAGVALDETTEPVVLESRLETVSALKDLDRAPVATLKVMTPREVATAGDQAVRSALLLLMVAAMTVMLVLWVVVRELIVSRVVRLKDHFATVHKDGRLRETLDDGFDDELGQLARNFNSMSEQVNHLRDVIADSAYLSGVSEWAAGTMHNVRNSLSPINSLSWRLSELHSDAWLKNVKMAVGELDAKSGSEERREKLVAFLQTSTKRFLDGADETRNISQDLIAASRGIEEIVAGYESLSRREDTSQDFDLLPLIADISKTVLADQNKPIDIILPKQSVTVRGNRTVVRQILLNLFWNAIEALAGRKDSRIVVKFESASSGMASLSIADNGEGIEGENLKSVFMRGFSTRKHKRGGLGLHWCANAAQSGGGSLVVESAGRGQGATFTLKLPAQAIELRGAPLS